MKVLIEIPNDHKRVIDNLVEDCKGYLLPYEVENRMAVAIRNGKVLGDMTRAEVHKEIFGIEPPILTSPYCKCKEHCDKCSHKDDLNCDVNWWNAPYRKVEK